jgi:hypothetical protein
MKKLILGLLVLLTIITGCTKKSEEAFKSESKFQEMNRKSINSDELSNDPDFIKLVIEMDTFNKFLKEVISDNTLSLNNVKYNLNELENKNLSYEVQLTQINSIFKTQMSDKLVSHMNNFSGEWKTLSNKYNNLNEKVLSDSYIKVKEKEININYASKGGWRYNLCLGAAFAGAVLCHAGCDTTALATTAGLGIPACIALCGVIQVALSADCYENYN